MLRLDNVFIDLLIAFLKEIIPKYPFTTIFYILF